MSAMAASGRQELRRLAGGETRLQDVTLEIIARTVFGSADPELRRRMKGTLDVLSKPGPYLAYLVVMGAIGVVGAARRLERLLLS